MPTVREIAPRFQHTNTDGSIPSPPAYNVESHDIVATPLGMPPLPRHGGGTWGGSLKANCRFLSPVREIAPRLEHTNKGEASVS